MNNLNNLSNSNSSISQNQKKNNSEKENLKLAIKSITNKLKTSQIPPWVTSRTKENIGIVKLHYEILDFYNFIKPVEEENLLRVKTFKLFTQMIKRKWPNWKVEMFGSFPNNIHLPDSDLDVVVIKESKLNSLNEFGFGNRKFSSMLKDSLISESDHLDLIYSELLKTGFVDEIRYVEAKVPIIKIKCKATQVMRDIS